MLPSEDAMPDEPWIEITANGPYRVSAGVPLKEMAPVHTFNGEPIAWHTLRELDAGEASYDLCRCGQSSTKPYCDKTHLRIPFNGAETANKAPYLERARLSAHDDQVLADDGRCIGAGFCNTRNRSVWRLFAGAEDPAERQLMQEMVWRCPSGRIALFQLDGTPNEPDLPAEIAVLPGGPLWIRGGLQIIDSSQEPLERLNRLTLCRCGQSRNKPFCDGHHSALHFDER
jgi:CDGSH-type Zn-finger protein